MDYKRYIREVPDFPKKGILFYDITTLLKEPQILDSLINDMISGIKDPKITKIAAIESRGFIFGAPIAQRLNKPFIPIRKPGKLPYKTISFEYELEYGKDKIEIHEDAIKQGDSVVIVDDLLATGGTMKAAADLVKECGGSVAALLFAIELDFLDGRKKLEGYKTESIIHY
ncbi:MAG: adenine phosphoribosyltransferase [Oligoflexia bacterium]|nr:adenine phosphoribosyltransferase [Oligoflexia bacterium]